MQGENCENAVSYHHLLGKTGPFRKINLVDTLISTSWSTKLWEKKFQLFKPPACGSLLWQPYQINMKLNTQLTLLLYLILFHLSTLHGALDQYSLELSIMKALHNLLLWS